MTVKIFKSSTHYIAFLMCCLSALTSAAQEKTTEVKLSAEQQQLNVESFDHVWKTVRDRYWDPQLGGLDWEAAKEELRPKVTAATTNGEARRFMRELLEKLQVSHFGIIPAEAYQKLDSDKPRGRHETGIDLRIVDDQVLVTEVIVGSPAAQLGVKAGWQLIQVGDTNVVERYQEIANELQEHPHRRTILVDAVKGKLLGSEGESIEVVFLNDQDKKVELSIPLTTPRGKRAKFGHIPEFYLWQEVKELEGNIGYFRFNAFMDPAHLMPKFNQAMADFKDADGFIIDVRGNGGGLGEIGTAMMGWLLPDGKQQMGTVLLRDTKLKMFVHPRANPYQGRVVVLTDELSISAAEFFASGMKELELAQIIGTRTAGAVLGSMIEKLPNGDGFQFAQANYISKLTGKTLEGIGVPPHQEVKHERKALLEGRDLQLEAAIAWIRQDTTPNNSLDDSVDRHH